VGLDKWTGTANVTSHPSRDHRAGVIAAGVAALLGGGVVVAVASPFAKPAPAAVSASVVASASASVTQVQCISQDGDTGTNNFAFGTGFQAADGVVTASHVVAACANGGQGQASLRGGQVVVAVGADDAAKDLALLLHTDAATRPLHLETQPAYVGERLALLGSGATAATGTPTAVGGTIAKTGQAVTLTAADGAAETLTDAITIATNGDGVVAGDSGGPAIDAAGNVVGVVEGGDPGVAYLTPASDVASAAGVG
jgi:hypothetical protein